MAALNDLERKIHQQFSEYGRNAREWTRKCVLLLPEIERRQIWRKKGCGSIFEYAAKIAGMSRSTVEEALRVLKRIEDKPLLMQLLEEKGLQRVRPIAAIASVENQEFWAQKAKSMGKTALETYVKDFRLEFLPREETQSVKVTMELEPKLAAQLEKLRGEGTWNELMEKLLAVEVKEKQRERPEPVQTKSRHIPMSIQNYLEERTGGLCAHPTCTRSATSLHHTQRWALEKVHDPARLQPLCTGHERIAHLGLIENEEADPRTWKFRAEPNKTHPKFFIDSMVALYRPG